MIPSRWRQEWLTLEPRERRQRAEVLAALITDGCLLACLSIVILGAMAVCGSIWLVWP